MNSPPPGHGAYDQVGRVPETLYGSAGWLDESSRSSSRRRLRRRRPGVSAGLRPWGGPGQRTPGHNRQSRISRALKRYAYNAPLSRLLRCAIVQFAATSSEALPARRPCRSAEVSRSRRDLVSSVALDRALVRHARSSLTKAGDHSGRCIWRVISSLTSGGRACQSRSSQAAVMRLCLTTSCRRCWGPLVPLGLVLCSRRDCFFRGAPARMQPGDSGLLDLYGALPRCRCLHRLFLLFEDTGATSFPSARGGEATSRNLLAGALIAGTSCRSSDDWV
jgi:hypothetical protein